MWELLGIIGGIVVVLVLARLALIVSVYIFRHRDKKRAKRRDLLKQTIDFCDAQIEVLRKENEGLDAQLRKSSVSTAAYTRANDWNTKLVRSLQLKRDRAVRELAGFN